MYSLNSQQQIQDPFIHSFIQDISIAPLQVQLPLRGALDYGIDTARVSRRSTTGNREWRICSRSLRGDQRGIRYRDPTDARHWTNHWATMPLCRCHPKFVYLLQPNSHNILV